MREGRVTTPAHAHDRRTAMIFTRGINDRVAEDTGFAEHVTVSLARFGRRDWGEMDDADINQNDWSIENGERVLAGYEDPDLMNSRIWIIREWDGSATTVLFPSEY
jgi:hypothetical protein